MRSIEKIEIVSDHYKLVSQHRIGGLQVDGYFQGASEARYDLQPRDIVLAILGFTNLTQNWIRVGERAGNKKY